VAVDAEVTDALRPAVDVVAGLGARVEQDCPDLTGADEVFRTLRAWQFELDLGAVRDAHGDRMKPSLVANIDAGRGLSGPDLGRAARLHAALFHRVREFFTRYDILLLPVSQVAPFDAALEYPATAGGEPVGSYLDWMRSAYLVSATGCPAMSVPAGFTPSGLPVGLQVVGPHRGDLAVLRAAHAFEQATAAGQRRPALP
jgi:amidase